MKIRLALMVGVLFSAFVAATSLEVSEPLAQEPADEGIRLQNRNDLKNWKPDTAFDLSKDLPEDREIRLAVFKAQSYLFSEQREDGSWDVELSGEILSGTADDAVDSIAATSMTGLALREFAYFNPERSEEAIRKGAEYVMERILRGKLSTKVWYAIWRYSFGIRFLMAEYRHSTDEAYKAKLFGVCRRMIDSIISMQKSNDELKAFLKLQRRNRSEISTRTGMIFPPLNPTKMTGGARVMMVEENSSAAKVGIVSGDVVVKVNKTPVANVYDFHLLEEEMIEGELVKVTIKKGSGEEKELKMKLLGLWPADTGIRLREGENEEGLIVRGFWPGSNAKDELEEGDVVYELNGKDVKTLDDVQKVMAEVKKIGSRVLVRYRRGKKKKSERVETNQRQPGWLGIYIDDEDKGSENGALISSVQKNSLAAKAGLIKGDRITRMAGHPISGTDHFNSLLGTFWEGQKVSISALRLVPIVEEGEDGEVKEGESNEEPKDGEAKEKEKPKFETKFIDTEVRLSAFLRRGQLQISVRGVRGRGGVYVSDVLKKGTADGPRGLKVDDKILSINGKSVGNQGDFKKLMQGVFAGEEVKIEIERRGRDQEVKVTAMAQAPTRNNEEGGWAYYFEKPHAPAFVTAAVILNFLEYDKTFEDISPRKHNNKRKDVVREAAKALMGLRVKDPDEKTYSYVYDIRFAENVGYHKVRGMIGRIMVGELAAQATNKISKGTLGRSLKTFFKYREQLDFVRNYPHTHYGPQFQNAAYYWLFGHYYAAMAGNVIGGTKQKKTHEDICKAVMLKRNSDGTWYGHKGFGKLCGTAHAMLILGQMKEMDWATLPAAPKKEESK